MRSGVRCSSVSPPGAEENVDDHAFRGGEEHLLDELLLLIVAAVPRRPASSAPQARRLEDPGVRGVREVEADDLVTLRFQREVRLPGDEHDVAEATHGDEGRPCGLNGDTFPSSMKMSSSVSSSSCWLAASSRARRGRRGFAVQADLLPVVLADVRVVPVDAGVREAHAEVKVSRPGSAPGSRASPS